VISRVVRLGLVAAILGGALDRWLSGRARRTGRFEPGPICASVTISAPPEAVWTELADLEGQPRWMTDLKAVRVLTPPPIGVGSQAVGVVRIFGVAIHDPVTIVEFEPPRRYAIRHAGPIDGHGLIELKLDSAGDTVVTWEERLIAPFLPFAFRAVSGPVLGRVFQADLERLKLRVESAGGAGGAGAGGAAADSMA
jgi:uncharacterized protein YndB with AHSA1/START domain